MAPGDLGFELDTLLQLLVHGSVEEAIAASDLGLRPIHRHVGLRSAVWTGAPSRLVSADTWNRRGNSHAHADLKRQRGEMDRLRDVVHDLAGETLRPVAVARGNA
jgi:hypothetical protein